MDTKKLTMMMVSAIVAIVLIATVLVPVISNIKGEETVTKTFYNTGSSWQSATGSHIVDISLDNGSYVITTDGVRAGSISAYTPLRNIAGAIGIGVYEAYNMSGTLQSRSGVNATNEQTIDKFRTQAIAGNANNDAGTYQLWNFYQNTLYKIMALTVMGNTDSQYMIGLGVIQQSYSIRTGQTTMAYEKSTSSHQFAVSLFIENAWGNINEFVGDVTYTNEGSTLNAGNQLGGNSIADVVGVNTNPAPVPLSSQYITDIYLDADVFGIPKAVGTQPSEGKGIEDVFNYSSSDSLILCGGSFISSTGGGIFYTSMNPYNTSASTIGSRLAYMTNTGDSPDYGYILTFDTSSGQTVISDVQTLEDGVLVSKMPTGTTLNSYWDFDSNGVGPFGCYYVAINMSSGDNADDSSETRLSKTKGEFAYRLNPNNLKQTMGGHTFDPSLYNVMLIVPTAYWGSDPSMGKLYVSSSPDTFEGIEMKPYAHTYSGTASWNPDPPEYTDYITVATGDGGIIRLYDNGKVSIVTSAGTTDVSTVTSEQSVTIRTTDSEAQVGMETVQVSAMMSSEGDLVYAETPIILSDTKLIVNEDGYVGSGTMESVSITAMSGSTVTDAVVNTSPYEYDGMFRMDSITFTDGGTQTVTTVIVAKAVSIDIKEKTVTGPLAVLLSVIPLLMVVAIISGMGVVMFRRRS